MYYSYKSQYNQNRSNFEKSKDTDGFKGWRKAQYAAQSGHCAWCYKKVEYKDMDVDHIHPVSHSSLGYDVNNFDNLVLACHECNRDKKCDTAYNVVAYNNTLNKMTIQQKHDGFAPKKIYWSRPEWIGPNKYSKNYKEYSPVNVPESERNVWNIEAPLVKDYSLKVDNIAYAKKIASDKINDNFETIWKVIKWIIIIGIVWFFISIINESNEIQRNKKPVCDYECQERSRLKFEAEEEKKRQKEEEEYYEEARRYWNCKAAGGSDFDCG